MRVEERTLVTVSAESVYLAVSNVRRMGEWSPECVGVWSRSQQFETGTRFIGWNRKRLWFWFTSCTVVRAEYARDFAFEVRTFGMPVALWGYRFEDQGAGCLVTEYWEDLRSGRSAPVTKLLGLVFTGTPSKRRGVINQEGMRATLARLKAAVERA
ncbi:SRPBCC family protein [Streptomyces capitiformicae]|uniref:SRPBCC family protein n=1 Tax=Streptomyces capitiformicae TaxID=2014920 RepID=UPI001E3581D5|nr:SRPBCC family protein [Streptomyces capitiformicae]